MLFAAVASLSLLLAAAAMPLQQEAILHRAHHLKQQAAANPSVSATSYPLTGLRPHGRLTELVTVDSLSGSVTANLVLPFTLDSSANANSDPYIDTNVVAYDSYTNTLYYIAQEQDHGYPSTLLAITSAGLRRVPLKNLPGQILGLAVSNNGLYGFMALNSTTPDESDLVLASIDPSSGDVKVALRSGPQKIFTIFRWIESTSDTVYVLMGDAYSQYELGTMIFAYDFSSNDVNGVLVDSSKFTIYNLEILSQSQGTFTAISPGVAYPNISFPAWTAVTVDTTSGAVTPYFAISAAGTFQKSKTPAVHYSINGVIFVRLSSDSSTSVIATLANPRLLFSEPFDNSVVNLAYLDKWTPPAQQGN